MKGDKKHLPYDEAKGRETRRKYRSLLEKINASSAIESTDVVLEEANRLVDDIQRPKEAHLDAKVFKEVVRKYSENADIRRGKTSLFQVSEFAARLSDHETVKDWARLGQEIQPKLKTPVPLEYLYGSFDKRLDEEASPTKKRKRMVKSNEPLIVSNLKMQTAESVNAKKGLSVDERVKLVEKALDKACRKTDCVHFYKFVTHPNSLSATVENMFYTSFLVQGGKASLRFKDEVPYIGLPRASAERSPAGNQIAMAIDKKMWQKWVEVLNLTEPMIKLPAENVLPSS